MCPSQLTKDGEEGYTGNLGTSVWEWSREQEVVERVDIQRDFAKEPRLN